MRGARARLWPAAFVVVAGCANAAHAQVAVAVTTGEDNAALRDVAAGAVDAIDGRWALLRPPLRAVDVAACVNDTACLVRIARARGASHIYVVGVASVGVRDYAVALHVVDVDGRVLGEVNAVVPATADPHADGLRAATPLAAVAGLPSSSTPSATPPSATPSSATPSFWPSLLWGGAAVVAVGGGAAVYALASDRDAVDHEAALVGAGVTVGVVSVGLAAAGVVTALP